MIVRSIISSSVFRGVVLGFIGGAVCSVIRVPLPWMLGPLFAMALARMREMRVAAPKWGRQTGQLIIGCALGQYFTPEVGIYVVSHSFLIIAAAFGTFLLGSLSALVLSRLTGTDLITSFFSSLPGGASEMVVLADRFGARLDKVALSHSLRVPLVVTVIPFLMSWSGASGTDVYHPVARTFHLGSLIMLFAAAGAAGLLLQKINVPNSWMFGPLFTSMLPTLHAYETSIIPPFLISLGQLLIGCSLGARFAPAFIREAPRFAVGVSVSIVVALCLSGCLGAILSVVGKIPLASAILGTAPGGLSEMCITAKALNLGVPLVTALHITRLIFLMTLSGPTVRLAIHASHLLKRISSRSK